jgi:inner membrane transporter RhtA
VKPAAIRAGLLPLLLLVVAMCSFQLGAAIAKSLFPLAGARGATVLRLSFAALMLLAYYRPWRARLSGASWGLVARYGVVMALMNLFFYMALARLPLGITVAIEFTGPLSVALWHSRRALDFLWVGLAVLGLGLLLPWRTGTAALDPLGVLLALGAALGWALYIVWGREAGIAAGRYTVALGSIIGALLVLPVGAAAALPVLEVPHLLGLALALALLSSAVPYSLEMWALTRLPQRVFGVSMSLEPALAALAGWVLLGEKLAPLQYLAIASIVVACVGAALLARAGEAHPA